MLEGFDAANVNSQTSFAARLATAQFCICKASDGLTFLDPDFAARIGEARAAHKLVGAYHFGEPDDDWAAQARWFVHCATPQPGDLLVLDIEVAKHLPFGLIARGIVVFAATVRDLTGAVVVLYSYTSFLGALLAAADPVTRAALLAMPLWVADPNHTEGHPNLAGWGSFLLHQYGLNGGLDADELNGDASTWFRYAVPSPIPPNPPLGGDMAGFVVLANINGFDRYVSDGFQRRHIVDVASLTAWEKVAPTVAVTPAELAGIRDVTPQGLKITLAGELRVLQHATTPAD